MMDVLSSSSAKKPFPCSESVQIAYHCSVYSALPGSPSSALLRAFHEADPEGWQSRPDPFHYAI